MINHRNDWDKRIGLPDSVYPVPDDKERLFIYEEALKRVSAAKESFICICILEPYEKIHQTKVMDDAVVLNLFPEFVNQKPEGELLDGSWFGNPDRNKQAHSQRIQVLKNCIEILKKKKMKLGDTKKVRMEFPVKDKASLIKGDQITFQDNVRHTTGGIEYQFKTATGSEVWLKESQFR